METVLQPRFKRTVIERSSGGQPLGYIDSKRFELPGVSGPTSALTGAMSGRPPGCFAIILMLLSCVVPFALPTFLQDMGWTHIKMGEFALGALGIVLMFVGYAVWTFLWLALPKNRGRMNISVKGTGTKRHKQIEVSAFDRPIPLEHLLDGARGGTVIISELSSEDINRITAAVNPYLPGD